MFDLEFCPNSFLTDFRFFSDFSDFVQFHFCPIFNFVQFQFCSFSMFPNFQLCPILSIVFNFKKGRISHVRLLGTFRQLRQWYIEVPFFMHYRKLVATWPHCSIWNVGNLWVKWQLFPRLITVEEALKLSQCSQSWCNNHHHLSWKESKIWWSKNIIYPWPKSLMNWWR